MGGDSSSLFLCITYVIVCNMYYSL